MNTSIEFARWDGRSLGSLKTEAEVREHFGLDPDDLAYMVFVDGQLRIFQYCVPFVAGIEKITEDNIESVIVVHRTRLEERYGVVRTS